jgi:hypothetical protein
VNNEKVVAGAIVLLACGLLAMAYREHQTRVQVMRRASSDFAEIASAFDSVVAVAVGRMQIPWWRRLAGRRY